MPTGSPSEHHAFSVRRAFNTPDVVEDYTRGVAFGLTDLEREVLCGALAGAGRILNLGCGAGREALGGAGEGRSLIACDVALEMCRRARSQFTAAGKAWPLVATDARRLPFRDEAFDAVLATNTLIQYISRRRMRIRVLREVGRVLRPGGRAAFHLLHLGLSPTAPGYLGPALIRNGLRAGFGFAVGGLNAAHNLFRGLAGALLGDVWPGLEPGDFATGRSSFAFFHCYQASEFRADAQAAGLTVLEQHEDLPLAPTGRPARFRSLHGWNTMMVCERPV
ncbi:MAG: class I SAM-dependent methyltransferase [Planctomycetes bacterium]|nr:class I SAM-dependent methyltransferase [Planctomycetota bacterium]